MGKTKQPHLILIIPRLWLKLTLKSTLMRPLTTNLKTLVKQAVKTSRKPSRKLRVGRTSSRQPMTSQTHLSLSLTISETLMALISLTHFVTKVLVDHATQFLSPKSLSLDSS